MRGSTIVGWLVVCACAPTERPQAGTQAAPAPRHSELPGPAPRGRSPEQAAALNQKCQACHQEIAQEWRASLHARAHSDAVYQRAFAIEPLAFCQGCHAPEADPHLPVPESVAAIGVACVTCHVLGSDVVGAPQRESPPITTVAPAHPVLRDARFGTVAACAGCHEFEFPDRSARKTPELMQSTLSEHARSPERDSSCASCHMPLLTAGARSHRSHVFAGGRDTALVQSALAVRAERSPRGVRVSLTPRQVGHAFPTGDLFRRLEVSAELLGPEWQVMASARRYLSRHWARQPSPFGLVLRKSVTDDRPLATTVDVELELGAAAGEGEIAWRVAYQRVEHPRSELEQDSVVEGEIELATGTLEGKR